MRAALAVALLLALALAASAAAQPNGFRSPSGNISCLFVPAAKADNGHDLQAQVLCSIAHSVYGARLQDRCLNPPGQAGAGVDWHGFSLGAVRRGSILCSGGILYDPATVKPTYVTLRYGASMHRGKITCRSRVTGVTCSNASGHGLFVSRDSWRAW